MEEKTNKIKQIFSLRHYYGDTVRSLFLIAAIIIFLMVPFGGSSEPKLAILLIASSIILTLFAGLTNPKTKAVAVIDSVISALGCFIFESLAISAYRASSLMTDTAFFVLQVLAIIFLLALYFSIKTVRGMNQTDDRPESLRDETERHW